MKWDQVVEKVTHYVVKIDTPGGHGTGFLCVYNEDHSVLGVATAHHVVAHADEWKEPLRIFHPPSDTSFFAKEPDGVIVSQPNTDSAVILLPQKTLKLPEDLIPLLPSETALPIGVEVGWLGFPGMDPHTLCFFSGNISARKQSFYLIDGVAINGVSGGPVFYANETGDIQIMGAISAYKPNLASGTVLPGLCVAQDVSHFNAITKYIKSWDEANKQRQKLEQQGQQMSLPPGSPPMESPEVTHSGVTQSNLNRSDC